MNPENLAYTLVQVIHNFGAAAVVGGAVFSFWPARQNAAIQRHLAWLVLIAWGAQAVSGSLFGAVSFHYYGQFPDIHGIAVAALGIKIAAAAIGFILTAVYLHSTANRDDTARSRAWHTLAVLGVIALTAAAFLRWFS